MNSNYTALIHLPPNTTPKPAFHTNKDNTPVVTYMSVKNQKQNGGKPPEKLRNNTTEPAIDSSGSPLADLYFNNKVAIDDSISNTGIAALSKQALHNGLSGFRGTVDAIMGPLAKLSKVHPFTEGSNDITGAFNAFKLVVNLYLDGRENDQRITAIKLQMIHMMAMLVWLHEIKDQDDSLLKDSLQPLMLWIKDDIEACGQDNQIQRLQNPARWICDEVHRACERAYPLPHCPQHSYLDKMDNKVTGILVKILDGLDTQLERNLLSFIKGKGGAEAFTKNDSDQLVQVLMEKSGEKIVSGKGQSGGQGTLKSTKAELKEEFLENINEALDRNMEHFKKKAGSLEKHGEYIVGALSKGAYIKIKDPDWKGNVKACNFVLALEAYFGGQLGISTPRPPESPPSVSILLKSPSSESALDLLHTLVIDTPPALSPDDRWLLKYLIIDDGATGFISIKEANTFARERPSDWSLLRWITFRAKGEDCPMLPSRGFPLCS
ncbi:hypothetical protein P691DRAFT_791731 [Macrolepiota fuliginosa MF-IS2]|uniref:Uncharacterized protein n=1 Tax=Macrolepiota fuliginosa MF-IS2 TaxID=1400762 RepID=A0A9P6BVY7_9AGAR|nr:hypothetical protein P691DRAFT_791731 [Macrolepiota fuliginosa MF-IS2]